MRISVVIPTVNRSGEVKKICECLARSTYIPFEVIIIEQGDISRLEKEIDYLNSRLNIRLIKQEEKSASLARQTGYQNSVGDVIFFFDDDIQIGSDYIQVATDFLKHNTEAKGLTGAYYKHSSTWSFKKLVGLFFGVFSFSMSNVVLKSGSYDFVRGANLSRVHNIQWLFGCNMVIKREVFDSLSFNVNFKKGSFGEDVMFTYKIYKKWPSSLFYLPELEVFHSDIQTGKASELVTQRMKIIYRYIFWRREVYEGSVLNVFAYIWAQFGLFGLDLIQTRSFKTFFNYVVTFTYLYQNRKFINSEEVDYNHYIFS